MNIIRKLTQSDSAIDDVRSHFERKIQNQETKDSGWRFDKIISMTVYFHKITELNVSSFGKVPIQSPALSNFDNDDK